MKRKITTVIFILAFALAAIVLFLLGKDLLLPGREPELRISSSSAGALILTESSENLIGTASSSFSEACQGEAAADRKAGDKKTENNKADENLNSSSGNVQDGGNENGQADDGTNGRDAADQAALEAQKANLQKILDQSLTETFGQIQPGTSFYSGPSGNEVWAVTLTDLKTGASVSHNGRGSMLSASCMKLFIMASIYEKLNGADPSTVQYQGMSLGQLLNQMITVSSNDAANSLTAYLGGGDFNVGMGVVNDYCSRNSYRNTSMGRAFMGSNAAGDNYTSSDDCAAILKAIYDGTCVSRKASAQMLSLLKGQTRKNKIPAGLSGTGAVTANKTGELDGAAGVAENDCCIVEGSNCTYILCVFSYKLTDRNATIRNIVRLSGNLYTTLNQRQ